MGIDYFNSITFRVSFFAFVLVDMQVAANVRNTMNITVHRYWQSLGRYYSMVRDQSILILQICFNYFSVDHLGTI